MIKVSDLAKNFTVLLLLLVSALVGNHAHARQTHEVRVIEPPTPKYPMLASWLRLEGHCEVRFAVDEDGLAFSVIPSCTRPIFCFEAKRAVTAVKFEPKRVDGKPTVRTNIVYPLEWSLYGSSYQSEYDPKPLEACEDVAVS